MTYKTLLAVGLGLVVLVVVLLVWLVVLLLLLDFSSDSIIGQDKTRILTQGLKLLNLYQDIVIS